MQAAFMEIGVGRMLCGESANLAPLEEFMGEAISFRVKPRYSREQFDIIVL
ncbi:MAG: hypothetical protein HKN19_14535 [Halioglobus sp.]|nr:hypothetical protein [Halioglobus sp.]